jgi:phosphatidylserine/phosphatidylglycerophosphate/cardiolipin synthase-like enzyme
VFGRKWSWGLRRHHFVGAGALASALGMYSFAARLGLVPADYTATLRWLTASSAPLLPGAQLNENGGNAYVPAAYSPYPYPAASADGGAYQTTAYPTGNYGYGDIACYFSPSGGCTDAVVAVIRQARQQILVQAYSFTSAPIANALVEAHSRGVAVFIVLDKSQRTEQYSGADYVAHAGIPTYIDAAHAIAHNKIMLIDGQAIITGSFNFTKNAEENNAENLLVIRNRPDLYQAYENNFRHHYEHSQPYQSRRVGSNPPARGHTSQFGGQVIGSPAAEASQEGNSSWPQAAQQPGSTRSSFSGFPR